MIKKLFGVLAALCILFPYVHGLAMGVDEAAQVEKEVLKLDLPKPMFVGTPRNIRSANLERITGKKRAPFYVPQGTELLSLEKAVSGSDMEPIIGEVEFVTDGEKSGEDGYYVEFPRLALPQPGPGLPGCDRPGVGRPGFRVRRYDRVQQRPR